MKILLILNDPPYGTERSHNGFRLAGSLAKRDDTDVRVFLMGDAVGCAAAHQKVPDGYYHLDRMLDSAARHGAEIGCCGTCLDARGMEGDHLTKGARRSTLDELTDWTLWADKVITFQPGEVANGSGPGGARGRRLAGREPLEDHRAGGRGGEWEPDGRRTSPGVGQPRRHHKVAAETQTAEDTAVAVKARCLQGPAATAAATARSAGT